MKLINSYNIEYINHLLGTKGLVLRGDSSRGDFPILNIYYNNNFDLILKVKDGIRIEDMLSNRSKGAKERFDIHFGKDILKSILNDLDKFAKNYGLTMDTKSFQMLDPTGTEHSEGVPLGKVKPLTRFPVICTIHYQTANTVVQGNMIYVDAENYPDKQRYHIGGPTNSIVKGTSDNFFEIIIPAEFVCRFIKSIELADILLK